MIVRSMELISNVTNQILLSMDSNRISNIGVKKNECYWSKMDLSLLWTAFRIQIFSCSLFRNSMFYSRGERMNCLEAGICVCEQPWSCLEEEETFEEKLERAYLKSSTSYSSDESESV